jgi:hypothetical protein
MKHFFLIGCFACLFTYEASAQAGTAYYLGRRRIAVVVITHNKEYLLTDTNYSRFYKVLKDKWVKEAYLGGFVPNPNDTLKYGKDAANGVNKYTIDDEHYPDVYLKLIKGMKYVGPANPSENSH